MAASQTTIQCGPDRQTCLLDSDAQCDPIWVCDPRGLRLAHIQTLGRSALTTRNCEAVAAIGRSPINGFAAYDQCARGCVGPRL